MNRKPKSDTNSDFGNVGLNSRFTRVIEFEDYSKKELLAIWKKNLDETKQSVQHERTNDTAEQEYLISKETKQYAVELLEKQKAKRHFGNAGAKNNLMTSALAAAKQRMAEEDESSNSSSSSSSSSGGKRMVEILIQDFESSPAPTTSPAILPGSVSRCK